ncbi:hypothetical protein V6N12_012399 [Hibiscus sabdariffa]|uniref:GDSL esterase/lipase n=1 Tax=Hibiscus sabdariffa TaxID=183260 RepID=A0ABR2CI17_9ROSI
MTRIMNCILIFSLFLLFTLGLARVVPVPPFNINQKSLLKTLSLENVKVDLPALYVFGDSFVDAGNNEHFNLQFHRNYTPYGIDFGGKSTGRYTNGRTVVDFIAQFVGLPFPPPVQSLFKGSDKSIPQTGINYACGFTGILESLSPPPFHRNYTPYGIDFGGKPTGRYTNGRTVVDFIAQIVGLPFPPPVLSLSKKDKRIPQTGLNYACGFTGILDLTPPPTLYRLGARKFVINNLDPTGCEPHQIVHEKCWDQANDRALLFNKRLSHLLKDLQSTLPGSKFVLVDLYKIFQDVYASPASYGFRNVMGTCCSKLDEGRTKACIPRVAPCKDRNAYVFFDPFNPTESIHFIWARRMLNDSSVTYPVNLIQLIQS